VFTQKQLNEQAETADKIVRTVMHQEKMGELSELAQQLKKELEKEE